MTVLGVSQSDQRPMAWRRFSAPELSHGLWTGLWAALVAVVTIVVLQTLTADETPAGYRILFRLVGTAYVACGLIAWRRRPDSRSGLLMTATGFLLFFEPLLDGFGPLGDLTEDVWSITIVWLLLTMLSGGRLISRVDKTLVGLFVLEFAIEARAWRPAAVTTGRSPNWKRWWSPSAASAPRS